MAYNYSSFTYLVENKESCERFLHNSYMGAMLRLPAALDVPRELSEKWRRDAVPYSDELHSDEITQILLRNGFLVDQEIRERARVSSVLEAETARIAHFIILPHEDCNFRCKYCYETFARGKMNASVAEGVKAAFTRLSADKEVMNVSWFGGEPTLAFDVMQDLSKHFLGVCQENDIEYVSSITTNAAKLEHYGEKAIAGLNLSHFQITLDGPRENHDALRVNRGGQGTFDLVWRNLLFLKRTSLNSNFCLRINITPESFDSVMEFVPVLADTFADDPRFYLDFHSVGQWGGPNDESLSVFSDMNGHDCKMALFTQARSHGFRQAPQQGASCAHGTTCYAGNPHSIVIGSDGTLYKCTVAFEDERNQIGRLDSEGNFLLDHARFEKWTRNYLAEKGKCGTCSFGAACQGKSCPLHSLELDEPNCPHSIQQLNENLLFAAGANMSSPQPE